MKAGFLYLTKRDLENMSPSEINLFIMNLNKKEIKQEPLPPKEEFEMEVKELVKQGKLDKKFLKEK